MKFALVHQRRAAAGVISFAILSSYAAVALAQPAAPAPPTAATIDTLQIAIWPEYDRPEALVMYRAKLDPATALPAQVTLPVPANVDKPHAVARQNANGDLFDAQHTYAVDGDWATVVVTTDTLDVQLEYYAPIAIEGNVRRFRFEWPGGPNVRQLVYEIQEPFGAAGVQITPAPARRGQRSDRLFYSDGIVAGRKSGDPGAVELTYQKADKRLTVASLTPQRPSTTPQLGMSGAVLGGQQSAQAPASIPRSATKPTDEGGTSPLLIIVLVVGAFGAGVFIGRSSVTNEEQDSES